MEKEKKNSSEACKAAVKELCEKIEMSEEAAEILVDPECAEKYGKGMDMLREQLLEAVKAQEAYQKLGISEEIYRATMGCFSRFVREHKMAYDCVGFDREWWTHRQIGLKLFRIGELEYELLEDGKISVHIPSDAKLTEENCRKSYREAEVFLKKYFPKYEGKDFVCESWLLSPALREILPEKSNIVRFQSAYTIVHVSPEDEGFMRWVFRTDQKELSKLPQDTSLQRNVKQRLEQGGTIGSAYGILKKTQTEE